jgi:quinol monooxygenase YgiN
VSELQGIARFKFHEGKLEEFKRLAARCMEVVRTKDTGTLQYEVYFNNDQSECVVLERYRDSDALIEHGAHLGELGQAILADGIGHQRVPRRAERSARSAARRQRGPALYVLPVIVNTAHPRCTRRTGQSIDASDGGDVRSWATYGVIASVMRNCGSRCAARPSHIPSVLASNARFGGKRR